MVYLIISDIHSNLPALLEFDRISKTIYHDKVVCLGDIVGYYADPNPVVDWVREKADLVVAGNHDKAAAGLIPVDGFNSQAKAACIWTEAELESGNKEFLAGLPYVSTMDGVFWCHASPYEPDEWHYIQNKYDAHDHFDHFSEDVCFVGHSHKPVMIERSGEGSLEQYHDIEKTIEPGFRYIVNVGSLGQPRDRIPESCFVSYDSDKNKIKIYRYSYDIKLTQRKAIAANLPSSLADRLEHGL